jgi:hypothetical protein
MQALIQVAIEITRNAFAFDWIFAADDVVAVVMMSLCCSSKVLRYMKAAAAAAVNKQSEQNNIGFIMILVEITFSNHHVSTI